MVVTFGEVTIAFCVVSIGVRLLDNFFHAWYAIKRNRACKEVKRCDFNCCSSITEIKLSSFLRGTHGNKFKDYCGFVGSIRDANVFSTQ